MKSFLPKAAAIFVIPTIIVMLIAQALPKSAAPARAIELAPMSHMPDFVHTAPADAQHAYRFAAANQEFLTHFPCYCGCVYLGHEHNLDCYIQDVNTDGTIVYDPHASVCGICVEITNDAARLWGDGLEIDAIHDYIVTTYSARGPSMDVG
jgi:hypothetical protein